MTFKPMLAATLSSDSAIRFPALLSPKLDGIRAMVIDGIVVSRNLKPIPNGFVQELWGDPIFNGFDGELIVGEATDKACFRNTTSGVMSQTGSPNVSFYVFDDFLTIPHKGFEDRICGLNQRAAKLRQMQVANFRLEPVSHYIIDSLELLTQHEEKYLELGFEGVMLRSLDGPYKFGRSTEREGWLVKVKRFADDEAIIVGFDEQWHNGNELTKDNLGRAHRTSHKENKSLKGTLGALKMRMITGPFVGVEFDCGTGFDDAERQYIWNNQAEYLGKAGKVKYFPTGSKDKPRFPTWLGLRPKGA